MQSKCPYKDKECSITSDSAQTQVRHSLSALGSFLPAGVFTSVISVEELGEGAFKIFKKYFLYTVFFF